MKAKQKWGKGVENMGLRNVAEPEMGPDDAMIEVGAVGLPKP